MRILRRSVLFGVLLCLSVWAFVACASTVTSEAPRGVSRRESPVGERPLLIVPPLDEVKFSDSNTKDFGSYLVRTSV